MNCDTSSNPIRTTVSRLHLSSGISEDGSLLTIEMYSYGTNSTYSIATSADQNGTDSGDAKKEDTSVDSNLPVSTKGHSKNIKDASIQIMKFHSFKAPQGPGLISFCSFFYFIGRAIPYRIIYRLRITYNSRLRNLEAGKADSLKTNCTIKDSTKAGTTPTNGENVNYECTANATGNANNAKIQLNTDYDLIMEDADGNDMGSLSFDEISFNGNATEEGDDIGSNKDVIDSHSTLKNVVASFNKYILKLSGTLVQSRRLLRRLALTEGQKVEMNLNTNENGQDVIMPYECTIEGVSSYPTALNCDTSDNPINTNVDKLHLSTGKSSDGTLLTVEMKNWQNNGTYNLAPTGSNYFYSKSSSGLSGGAIAGIIIACVVVLLAASIIAVMLRKPSTPPVENTTVVELRNNPI